MTKTLATVAALFSIVASSAVADLPEREEVFTIGIHSPQEHNLMSRDFIFSALPDYEEIDRATVRDYPSHKTMFDQQGVIVLKDKTVLFFQTRSSKYLNVIDSSNRHTFYRLPEPPAVTHRCPRPEKNLSDLAFPAPSEVFVIATFPWNQGDHFTPESLEKALPRFRLLTADDVPELAAVSIQSGTHRTLHTPAEWMTPAGRRADVLNGVIVLENRAVLKWITWTPTAIAFSNYRYGDYFVLEEN